MIWSAVVQRRSALAVRLLAARGALDLGSYTVDDFTFRAIWAPILPNDRHALVADEIALAQAGLHSRHLAMQTLGVRDPDAEDAVMHGQLK